MAQALNYLFLTLSCFTHDNIYLPHNIIYALLLVLDTNFLSAHLSFFLFELVLVVSTLSSWITCIKS